MYKFILLVKLRSHIQMVERKWITIHKVYFSCIFIIVGVTDLFCQSIL